MAKLGFAKLGLKPNNEIVEVYFGDQVVEVKQYLPVEEKLELIGRVLELSHDQNNFSNPVKVDVYTMLEIIDKYTNITFTDKQKENPTKLYDLIVGNGFAAAVVNAIPEAEYGVLIDSIERTIKAVYKFKNSVLGILDSIATDYSDLNLDINALQEKLSSNPEALGLLKEVVTKLG